MAQGLRLICASTDVPEAGSGFRFVVSRYGREVPAFVIRLRGLVHAYLNECSHVPAELDWMPGEFFDNSKLYLICSIHGALYAPETGKCLGGPCHGHGLKPVGIVEQDGQIFLQQDDNHGQPPTRKQR